MIITIDGPAGAGKSTAARLLAEKLSAAFLDTGAMYRTVTLAAMQNGIDPGDTLKVLDLLKQIRIEFRIEDHKMRVFIDGEDVSGKIRTPEVTAKVRFTANAPAVRKELVKMQRQLAAEYETVVCEGRDQGTVVFPQADFKFYLTADISERAKRRQGDFQASGISKDLSSLEKEIAQRDSSDTSREEGPLKPAADAVHIDSTNMNARQVVEKMLEYINSSGNKGETS